MTTAEAASEANCTAVMFDSQNAITAEAMVEFGVNATVVDDLAVSDGTREDLSSDGTAGSATCRDTCGLVNVPCMIWRRCGSELAQLAGACIGVLTVCAPPG